MEPKTLLVMYSSGLDSVAMLNKLLYENRYDKFHIHHIHIKNIENRHKAEELSCIYTLNYFKNISSTNIQISGSEIGAPVYNNSFMYDIDVVSFFAGYIASTNPDIIEVAIGMNKEDISIVNRERKKRADIILSAFSNIKKIYPIENMSKKELYESIPISLKHSFWSCRKPIYKENIIYPCNECRTCSTLKTFSITHPNLFNNLSLTK